MKYLLSLLLLFSVYFINAQTILHAYAVTIARWDDVTEDYTWGEPIPIDLKFTIQGEVIMVNDVAESTYICIEKVYDSEEMVMYTAIDEDHEDCRIILQYPKNQVPSISVEYAHILYVYGIE
jgi:hypothetical protein